MHWVREGGLADSGEGKGTGLEQGAEGTWLCGRGEGTDLDRGGGGEEGDVFLLFNRAINSN